MKLTLLVDLDDTLLVTNLDHFIHSYFQALSQHVASYGIGDGFINILGQATQRMLQNRQPELNLKEVFDAAFFPALQGILPAHLKSSSIDIIHDSQQPTLAILNEFYEKVFPSLQKVTQKRPEAITFIREAQQRNYRIAIATNPLFPRTATLQRLAWAGLSVQDYSFEIISTYETFHFTKPEPAYYAEVLAQMGWQQDGVVMVGNDVVDDIEAAQNLGLPTFWVKPNGNALSRYTTPQKPPKTSATGDLGDVMAWIDSAPTEKITPNYSSPKAIEAIMRSTGAALLTWFESQNHIDWKKRPLPNEWAPVEIICHLRDVEAEIFLPRLKKACTETIPHLENISAETWADERRYREKDPKQAIQAFVRSRKASLDLLETLDSSAWTRTAIHPVAGLIDFTALVERISSHDQIHIRQLKAALR